MNETQNNQMPPQQQTGPQGPAASPQAGAQCQGGHQGQGQYQGYSHPPAPGYGPPPWAQQDRHQGGHPAYYGPPSQAQQSPHPGYGPHPGAHGYQAAAYGPHPGYYAQPAYAPHHHDSGLASFFNFRDERFVKGAITGAALTFLLTNDSVQKNGIKSLVKLWSLFQSGMEEIKERFKDAEAEIKTEEQPSQPANG